MIVQEFNDFLENFLDVLDVYEYVNCNLKDNEIEYLVFLGCISFNYIIYER